MLPKPNDAFAWVQDARGPALVCRPLGEVAAHVYTSRAWRLGTDTVASDPDTREAAWAEVAAAVGVGAERLGRARQVHGAAVIARKRGEIARNSAATLADGDILVSDDPNGAVAVQTADCVPLLLADRRGGIVGAAHAGWRGLAAGVPRIAVEALATNFGTAAGDLIVAIGPSISAAQYEVDAPVRDAFVRAGFEARRIEAWFPPGRRAGHWQFDGWAAARDQLIDAGVPSAQIFVAGLCTATHGDVLCSYRRDGKAAGRLAAAIRPSTRA